MRSAVAAQIHVRIGRIVVEEGALGAIPRAEFGARLQSAIAAQLAGGATDQHAASDPVAEVAGAIAARLPPEASANRAGSGRHGRR